MKDENLTPKFRMRLDEDHFPAENYHQEEMLDRRIDKVNLRITLLAFLIPLLIGVILFVLYLEFSERIMEIQNSGSARVQSVSRDMEGRLSALTLQYTKLGSLLEENYLELEKHIGRLQDQIDLTGKTLQEMTASKMGTQDLEKAVAELTATMNRQLEPLAAQQKALQAEIKNTSRELGNLMTRVNETADKTARDMEALRAKLAAATQNSVSKKDLEALRAGQTRLEQEQTATIRKLTAQLAELRQELQRVAAQKSQVRVVPAEPGTIVEQDIPN